MKKKLMSLLSLILAVIMVFPAAVFAVDPTPNATLYYNSTDASKKTCTFTYTGEGTVGSWRSTTPSVATVTNGVVTALSAGTTYIYADDATGTPLEGGKYFVKVEAVALTGIEIVEAESTKSYIAGTYVSQNDLKVKATYNDGTVDNNFKAYTITPAGTLTTSDTAITVTATADTTKTDTLSGITVMDFDMEDMVKSITVSAPAANTEYTVGNTLKKSDVKILVTYKDNSTATKTLADTGVTCSGIDFNASGNYTFSDTDLAAGNKTITVTYADCSASVTVKVKAAATTPTPDTTWSYRATVTTAPTKTTYNVGETFDPAGMKVTLTRVATNGAQTTTETLVTGLSVPSTGVTVSGLTAFNSTSTTSATFAITTNVTIDGSVVSKTFTCTVSGLTVISKDTRNIKSVDNVVLVNSKYSVGKVFSKEDISYIQVTFVDGYRDYIRASEFDSYAFMDSINLLVLNAQGKDKTTNWSTIEQNDILVDTKTGAKSVRLALYYRKYASSTSTVATQGVYAPTTFVVGIDEPDIAFWAGSTMKGEFTDLELALDATVNGSLPTIGNPNAPTISLGATDRVTLVLGKDTSVSKYYSFSPSRYVTIDLNGNDLVFYSDTISIPTGSRYELVVTNSSDTPATFTYADKGIELTVTKGNGFAFEYGKELPGFYTVSITAGSYGKVTASPSLDKDNKVKAPMGSTVEIMITPNTGYEVYDVVVEGKSVKNDKENYSLKENTGVVIYKLKDVSEDTEVVVTFQAKKSQWKNPFRDVKETDDYYSAVEFVNTNELFQGTSTTTFAPNNTMTRAMFVTVLGRLAGIDEATAAKEYGYTSDFKDVSASNNRITYAVPYIKWAVENGIIEGYGDGNFGPENPITHQQMYLMMYRYSVFVEGKAVSTSGVSLSGISDRGSVADWAETGVKMAKKYDFLVYTTGSRIEPTAVAKRHELAQLLEKYCANVLEWDK